jgi:hypothetical protein
MGDETKEKYYELRHDRHRQQRQDRELCPNVPLIGEVLHCRTLPIYRQNQFFYLIN